MALKKDTTVSYLLQDFKQFFDDPGVTEICVNAPGEVWCENKGKWVCTKVEILTYPYRSEEHTSELQSHLK